MSRENVEIVRRLVDAFNRHDAKAAMSVLDPGVEFESALIERKTYRGLAGMRRYREDLDAVWSEWQTEDDRFLAAGVERVLHLYRIVGRGIASGVSVKQDIAILWTVREGMIVHGRVLFDQDQALEAAGLRE